MDHCTGKDIKSSSFFSSICRFDFEKAAYILSLDSAIHLAVLLLLPVVSTVLLTRYSMPNLVKDIWLARISNLFFMLGCVGIAFSLSPPTVILGLLLQASTQSVWTVTDHLLGIIVCGFGAGYGSATRGLLTSVVARQHRALLYSIMSVLDISGTLIGAPLWPAVWQIELKASGLWIGLPFAVAACLFAVVSLMIEASRSYYP